MAATRKLVQAQHQSDAEDLVQDAIVRLVELWQAGKGPDRNARAYVVVSIRHAYIDRLRSPRSRVRSLDDLEATPQEPAQEESFSPDLIFECEAVQHAFLTLSDDHRVVLAEVLVNGAKPADLVECLGRPAPAISNLLARAKVSLRRALLIEYLSSGSLECAEFAHKLPTQIHDSLEQHEKQGPALEHAHDCEDCTSNWRRFAAVGALLGVVPLFVVAQFSQRASAGLALLPEASAALPQPITDVSAQSQTLTPSTRTAVTAPVAGAMIRQFGSKKALAGGLVLLATGVVVLAGSLLTQPSGPETMRLQGNQLEQSPLGEAFNADLSGGPGESSRTLTASFDAGGSGQSHVDSVRLEVSAGNEIVTWPSHLDCSAASTAVKCKVPPGASGGTSLVFDLHTADTGTLTLELSGGAGRDAFRASATGEWN
ncbi:sigma-70 family RNA polymerase sigma factor [Leucobacter sp. HY1910]